MADIELVIKIPEEIYIHSLSRYKYQGANDIGLSEFDKVGVAIKNSIPLPKGHGRLIDANMVVSDIDTERVNLFMDGLKGTPRGYQHLNDLERIMDEIPTVIEADREVQDE